MHTSRFASIVAVAALAASLVQAPALAIPGTTIAQFQAWAKSNPGLHGLSKQLTNQDTGQPYYTGAFRYGSAMGKFQADVGNDNKISGESVAVDTTDEAYDILKHPDVEAAMIAAVYGAPVGDDFKTATKIGQWKLYGQTHSTALYRGKLYGYEASLFSVQLIPLSNVDSENKRLLGCLKTDCNGD